MLYMVNNGIGKVHFTFTSAHVNKAVLSLSVDHTCPLPQLVLFALSGSTNDPPNVIGSDSI